MTASCWLARDHKTHTNATTHVNPVRSWQAVSSVAAWILMLLPETGPTNTAGNKLKNTHSPTHIHMRLSPFKANRVQHKVICTHATAYNYGATGYVVCQTTMVTVVCCSMLVTYNYGDYGDYGDNLKRPNHGGTPLLRVSLSDNHVSAGSIATE